MSIIEEILIPFIIKDLIKVIYAYLTPSNQHVLGIENVKFDMKEIIKYDSHLMVYCIEKKYSYIKDSLFKLNAKYGNLDNLKWLLDNHFPFDEWTFAYAVERNNLDTLKWLLNNHFPFDEKTFAFATESGNLDTLKWLLDNHFPFSEKTFAFAAEHANLSTLKWL